MFLRYSVFLFFGYACCLSAVCGQETTDQQDLGFRDLFNGKDLTGWIDVNTSPETWSVKDGLLVCTGKPIGVMRSDRQYENFILEIEWRHMEPGGNSGVFLWCDAIPDARNRLPKGMEVQMLELDWVNQHKRKDGSLPPIAYVQGELFGAGGMTATPENPRGNRPWTPRRPLTRADNADCMAKKKIRDTYPSRQECRRVSGPLLWAASTKA